MINNAPPLENLQPATTAFFFDCDGTLARIVDQPDAAGVDADILQCLQTLWRATDGALAIVSGRSILQLDTMLSPLKLPLAGVHGIERRNGDGVIFRPDFDAQAVGAIAEELERFVAQHQGLVCEVKSASVALHYRMRPELEPDALSLMSRVAGEHAAFRLLRGKMVAELSASHRTKGDAIEDFMQEAPFAGRLPVFVGDDVTDEDGFAVLGRYSGLGIKIGEGPTLAAHRIATLDGFHAWLHAVCETWITERPAL